MDEQADLDKRLSSGMKRWAEAGQPTLDLQALVTARLRAPAEPAVRKKSRPWMRWAISAAAMVTVIFGVGFTFPMWAGAAARWPLVGPMVTEIIMKDAGLKWAYDMGLIQGSMAQVQEGDITVKILGIVADTGRTTLLYQVTGYAKSNPDKNARPIPASNGLLSPWPEHDEPYVSIATVDGVGMGSQGSSITTPLGLIGTASTLPLPHESTPIQVAVRIGTKVTTLDLTVSRQETSKFSREVPVNQTKTIDGVTVTVQAVIYTPAETVVRYTVKKNTYWGGVSWSDHKASHYLEHGGKPVYATHSLGLGPSYESFPAVPGPTKFVIPMEYKAVDANLVWDLKGGATQQVGGTTITLSRFERQDELIAFEWRWRVSDPNLIGFADLEVVDAKGATHSLQMRTEGQNSPDPNQDSVKNLQAKIPKEFEPVAIRAKQTGWWVQGPFVFDLPNQ